MITKKTIREVTFTGEEPTAGDLSDFLADLPDNTRITVTTFGGYGSEKSEVVLSCESPVES